FLYTSDLCVLLNMGYRELYLDTLILTLNQHVGFVILTYYWEVEFPGSAMFSIDVPL
ncbi:hypothetical protein ACJX0J_029230, partial [Zea mays]